MGSASINGELKIEYPEGFEVMSSADLREAFTADNGRMWGARDKERHIILQVLWHKPGGLFSKAADLPSIIKADEARIAKGYKRAGFTYHLRDFFKTSVCGGEAEGLAYDFVKGDVEQVGVAVDFKHGNLVYKLNYYTRRHLEEENRAVFDEILAKLSF